MFKNWLHDLFVVNKKTTWMGLTTFMADITAFGYEWLQRFLAAAEAVKKAGVAGEAASKLATMPNPSTVVLACMGSLLLIFYASDPRSGTPPTQAV